MSIEQLRPHAEESSEGRALLLAALGLITLLVASGGFLGLVHHYERALGES
jgi:hypothetical protein